MSVIWHRPEGGIQPTFLLVKKDWGSLRSYKLHGQIPWGGGSSYMEENWARSSKNAGQIQPREFYPLMKVSLLVGSTKNGIFSGGRVSLLFWWIQLKTGKTRKGLWWWRKVKGWRFQACQILPCGQDSLSQCCNVSHPCFAPVLSTGTLVLVESRVSLGALESIWSGTC